MRCSSPTTWASSGSPTWPRSRWPAATRASSGPTGWRLRTCARRASTGRPTCRPCGPAPTAERSVLAHQLETGFGCVPTSSMGRLFDAVASLTGVRHVATYEAEAAMVLESTAAHEVPAGDYAFAFAGSGRDASVIDPGPVLVAIVRDLRAGVPVPAIAAHFHSAVVDAVVEAAVRAREAANGGLNTVVLSGGVFQNARIASRLPARSACRRLRGPGAASGAAQRRRHRTWPDPGGSRPVRRITGTTRG